MLVMLFFIDFKSAVSNNSCITTLEEGIMSSSVGEGYRNRDFVGRSFSGDSFSRCFKNHPLMNPHLKKRQKNDYQILREYVANAFVGQKNVNIGPATKKVIKEVKSNKDNLGLSPDSDALIRASFVPIQMTLLACADNRNRS